MRICTYRFQDTPRAGLVHEDEVLDVCAADDALPRDVAGWLAGGEPTLQRLGALAPRAPRQSLDPARLCAPLPRPRVFIAAGLNYKDHAKEVGRQLGAVPHLFTKLPGTEAAPFASIEREAGDDTLDYEGELGFVVGARCRGVSLDRAPSHIAGYVVVNDLSLRALLAPETLILAKGGAGYAPFGPWITTRDDVPDPHALALRTWVNGELRQDSSTAQLHLNCFELLSLISRHVTLEPGDIVTTGSPSGSGIGFDPPRYLSAGDRVRVEIEGLGAIENRITLAPPRPRHAAPR